jgi:hypothetical protein
MLEIALGFSGLRENLGFKVDSRQIQSPNRTQWELDGCPTFASAYVGRK